MQLVSPVILSVGPVNIHIYTKPARSACGPADKQNVLYIRALILYWRAEATICISIIGYSLLRRFHALPPRRSAPPRPSRGTLGTWARPSTLPADVSRSCIYNCGVYIYIYTIYAHSQMTPVKSFMRKYAYYIVYITRDGASINLCAQSQNDRRPRRPQSVSRITCTPTANGSSVSKTYVPPVPLPIRQTLRRPISTDSHFERRRLRRNPRFHVPYR